ncbi:MAG: inositol monophosphatase [Bacteroidales bacterium]|nr:inositol monophosphatase [Bacteroidales bacterium]
MKFDIIADQAIALVRETGELVRREREKLLGRGIISKGKNDFVTQVDKAAEEHLAKGLSQILPGCGFIAEEGTVGQYPSEYVWIIDPIDGTTNFIHGAPPYSISVGLMVKNALAGGIVYEITADECFYAFKGGKAYLNGGEIKVSSTPNVKDALLATGFPYTEFSRMEAYMQTMQYFFHNSHGVRRLGSAAADLAYVACGRYDGFYEYDLKPYDVAAGAFIIEAAGGRVTDFKGGNDFLFGKEIVAGNSLLFDELQSVIGSFLNK